MKWRRNGRILGVCKEDGGVWGGGGVCGGLPPLADLHVEGVHVARGRVGLLLVRGHVRRADDHQRIADVHGVDSLRQRDGLDRVRVRVRESEA